MDGMEYMDVDADKDDNTDEDCVYECDFDINEFIDSTLAGVDVGSQVQDAIDVTNSMMNIVSHKYHYTSLVFGGLDADVMSLDASINNLDSNLAAPANRGHMGDQQSNKIVLPVSGNRLQEYSKYLKEKGSLTYANMPKSLSRYTQKSISSPESKSRDIIQVANVNRSMGTSSSHVLPPVGPFVKKHLVIGSPVYAPKTSCYGAWSKAKIADIKFFSTGEKKYKIKYIRKLVATVTGKQLAYADMADVMLPVGCRVIAQYSDECAQPVNLMYSGIIAEPPKMTNDHRYLVFFDDGYAQYAKHSEIRAVVENSEHVWDDIQSDSKEFIKTYLTQYPERPMVKLRQGHTVKTEWNGRWWIAKVVEVDGSLAKMYFHADKRTEWIYRGSTRLGPLYSELTNAEQNRLSGKSSRRHNLSVVKKTGPYVEYTRGGDDPSGANNDSANNEEKRQVARKHTLPKSNVARKSTTSLPTPMKYSTNPAILPENDGEISNRYIEASSLKKYTRHECCSDCLSKTSDNPATYRGQNPLTIPMHYGWQRILAKHKSTLKTCIIYRAPCGRRLRNMDEIHKYLKLTKSLLTMDLFCCDNHVMVFCEFVPTKVLSYIKDVSGNKEVIPVCGVNSLNREYPDYVEYSTQRIPNKGVNLNLDPEFLICCSCDDDCSDPSRCECQQLTFEASKAAPKAKVPSNPLYTYKRLKEGVMTGIYECNHLCKCNSRCLNRVVQNGLQLRLQIFKTEKRGWGIRCLDDIPHGGFICIYAGQLLTEQGANEDGTQYGDEYLAELDYIEVVERLKEDYESDVIESETETNEKEKRNPSGSDDEAGKDDSDDYNCEGEKNDSSDSDFESGVSSVGPRTQQTRLGMEKLKKLVLRREPSDADSSNQSWNVHQSGGRSPSSDISSKETDENKRATPIIARSPILIDENEPKKIVSLSSSSSTTSECSKEKPEMALPKLGTEKQMIEDENKEGKNSSKDKCRSFADPMSRNENSAKAGKFKPTRSYFGDEFCYIMDAKALGNIGRYLNHNCAPNVFVQNVFVDTHDIRFPWVAFFSLQYIRAGTELTWDYSYEVGSVPNKVMYCYCGADKCRGRLL